MADDNQSGRHPFGASATAGHSFQLPGLGSFATQTTSLVPPTPSGPSPNMNFTLPPELRSLSSEQLNALMAHIQSGALSLPPSSTQASPLHVPVQAQDIVINSSLLADDSGRVTTGHDHGERDMEVVTSFDTDKEEGELSDASMDMALSVASPVVSKKRKSEASNDSEWRKLRRVEEDRPDTSRIFSSSSSSETAKAQSTTALLQQERQQSLRLISELHKAGYTFRDILHEVDNEALLCDLFNELGLSTDSVATHQHAAEMPMTPVNSSVPIVNAATQRPSSDVVENDVNKDALSRVPVAKDVALAATCPSSDNNNKASESRKASAPIRTTPVKLAVPLDRNEYLARLKAARTRKGGKPAESSIAKLQEQPSEPSLSAVAVPQTNVDLPPSQETLEGTKAASKQNQLTELARKKLEALKAMSRLKEQQAAARVVARSSQAPVEGTPSDSPIPSAALPKIRKPATPQNNSVMQPQARKRPVAADFMEAGPTTTLSPYRRPFGQSGHNSSDEQVVINVSDGDSEYEGQTTGDEADDRGISSPNSLPGPLRSAKRIKDFPPLRDFPSRSTIPYAASGSLSSTTPVTTPGGRDEVNALSRKQRDIAELQLRIAELENRKAASVATKVKSTEEPTTNLTEIGKANGTVLIPPVISAMPSLTLKDMAAPPAAALTEPEKQQHLDAAIETEKLRLQQRQQALEQQFTSKSAKLNALRKFSQKFKLRSPASDNAGGVTSEQRETQSVKPTAVVQGAVHSGGPQKDSGATGSDAKDSTMLEVASGEEAVETQHSLRIGAPEKREQSITSYIHDPASDPQTGSVVVATSSIGDLYAAHPETTQVMQDEVVETSHGTERPEADVSASLASSPASTSSNGDADMDTSSASDFSSEASLEGSNAAIPLQSGHNDVRRSSSSASSRPESDYEPEEQVDDRNSVAVSAVKDSPTVHEPSHKQGNTKANSLAVNEDTDAESDYEPMDHENGTSTELDRVTSDATTSKPHSAISQVRTDNVALELQPSNTTNELVLATSVGHRVNSGSYYTPYISPLMQSKKYRFHPNYKDEASRGYKSLTYSHRIGPNDMLCPFESAGGTCNDPKCDYQHFRDMGLDDHLILVQLGTQTANPGKTPEESERFNTGLRNLIQRLKAQNISDIERIAEHIVRYRREFIGDNSALSRYTVEVHAAPSPSFLGSIVEIREGE